jgi:phage gp36-like protein
MKYSTIEDIMASFPHPVLPTLQGEPDYQTIHATRKFLQANSRAIDTHLGGRTLGHLGLMTCTSVQQALKKQIISVFE